MKNRIFKFIAPLAGFAILCIALVFLTRELQNYRLHEIILKIRSIPAERLILAGGITVAAYYVLTFYDFLAFRYIKKKLPYPRILFTSLVSYIFGNNIGMSVLSSGTVRFRFYGASGVSSIDIIKIITFTATTFWIGILTLAGVVFTVEPMVMPQVLHLPFSTMRPLGVILLLIVLSYLTLTVFFKKTFTVRDWEIDIPGWRVALGQIAVSFTDWSLAGVIMYLLLPDTLVITLPAFLGIYILAQITALISHVPGGIGVFETVMMLMLSGSVEAHDLFSSLVLYRFIYYLCPFGLGLLLFTAGEIAAGLKAFKKITETAGKILPRFFPALLAILTFFAGALILLSAAWPNLENRMIWLDNIVPMHLIQISHFVTALTGTALMFLSSRIQKRIDAAYYATLVLIGLSIISLLLNGLNYEEAIILTVILAAFIPCRSFFYRKASMFDQAFSPGWFAAMATVIAGITWTGFFAYKHVHYTSDLWFNFGLLNDASRFVRGGAGVLLFLTAISVYMLMRPARPRPDCPTDEEMELARSIIEKSDNPDAYLALLGDKYLYFNQDKTAFLMYGIQGGSWIVLGDPVGNYDAVENLMWDFMEESHMADADLSFFEVTQEHLPLCIEMGMSLLKIGETAKVDLPEFSIEGHDNRAFRHSVNKLNREGYSFEIVPVEFVPGILPELKEVSDKWLESKHTREKQFSIGYFNESYLSNFSMAVIKKERRITAFANIMKTECTEIFTIDLMRYIPDSPGGIMDYLFINIMLWGKQNGYRYFDLGSVPLAGLTNKPIAPLWNRIGSLIFGYGEFFYNFQGLRNFKNKFSPEWHSTYLAYSKPLSLPGTLKDIAILVGGGIKGVISK